MPQTSHRTRQGRRDHWVRNRSKGKDDYPSHPAGCFESAKAMRIVLYSYDGIIIPKIWELLLPSETSAHIICPWCGRVWAAVLAADLSFFQHRYIPCTEHPEAAQAYGCNIGGSLLELDEFDLLDSLPPELLKREFDLYTKETS